MSDFNFEGARIIPPGSLGGMLMVLPKDLNTIVGDTPTLITRPGDERVLAIRMEVLDCSLRPGDYRPRTFADGDVTVGTDVVVVDDFSSAHEFQAGDGPYQLTTSGVLPAGLALATEYYVEVVDADEIAFHTSRADAIAADTATRVDITAAAGGGTHTIGGVPFPAVTEQTGYGSINIDAAARITNATTYLFSAPSRMTVEGSGATMRLVYWFF